MYGGCVLSDHGLLPILICNLMFGSVESKLCSQGPHVQAFQSSYVFTCSDITNKEQCVNRKKHFKRRGQIVNGQVVAPFSYIFNLPVNTSGMYMSKKITTFCSHNLMKKFLIGNLRMKLTFAWGLDSAYAFEFFAKLPKSLEET